MKPILLVLFPLSVFLGGIATMSKLTGHDHVTRQLRSKLHPKDAKPLQERLAGYDLEDVSRLWGALDDNAYAIEQLYLKIDLVFPFFYGAALTSALLIAWSALGRPFHVFWLLSPIAISVAADWAENLIHSHQLDLYIQGGYDGLQSTWIRIASFATTMKFAFLFFASLMLLGLVMRMLFRPAVS